jgi:hypothetical protein
MAGASLMAYLTTTTDRVARIAGSTAVLLDRRGAGGTTTHGARSA